MNANRKITLIIFSMVSLLVIIIVALVALGSRNNGYESAKKRAYLTAEIVKESLTSHMVAGTMDKRDIFLDAMKRLKNVEDLWVVRAKSVTEQYGDTTFGDQPRDSIDEFVLKTGKEGVEVKESLRSASLRITIPYIASANDKPNCLICHNAKEGEVLGAISVTFDIQDDRIVSIISLIKIIGTSVIFLALILIFINKKIKPYTSIFDSITETLKKVHEGDYSIRAKGGVYKEDKETIMWLNEMVEKLEKVLTGIEKNLTSFVHNRSININNDKLLTAQDIIKDIAEIYNFKKTIETDLGKEDIHYRLTQVLQKKLNINNFVIFENDLNKNEREIITASEECTPCCSLKTDIKELCRAERTGMVVQSDNFPEICRFAECNDLSYICIPAQISEQSSITISIICKNEEELKHAKYQIGIIKKYIEEAKPILESRMLTEVLRRRNYIDGLTGLYNRKFLDDFIDKKLPKELNEGNTYAILLLDVDHFKMVNDTYGHDAGDTILQKLSATMKSSVSEDDFVIRYGGEEFLILLKNPTEKSAKETAISINEKFAKIVFRFNNETFSKTVSIGYAFYPQDTDKIWRCIKYADVSLYEAKETGRNRVVRFHTGLLKDLEGAEY